MKLLLIDSGYFWAIWHASASKPVTFARDSMLSAVRALSMRADLCAVALDMGPYDRLTISPTYKGNRPDPDPRGVEQLDLLRADLAALWLTWGVPGCEADDIIATATRWARTQAEPLDVVIVSSDKDLRQLIAPGVNVYDPRTKQLHDGASVEKDFGVRPDQLADYLALVGDAPDNIPGVMGLGDKGAGTLLREHGTIAAILHKINDTTPDGKAVIGPPKTRAAILGAVTDGTLVTSQRLVALRYDAPIDCADVLTWKPKAAAMVVHEERPVARGGEMAQETIEGEIENGSRASAQMQRREETAPVVRTQQPAPMQTANGNAMTSEQTDILFQHLAAAQCEFGEVVKTRTANIRRDFSYMYANLSDVCKAIMPALKAHGIVAIQIPRLNRMVVRIVHGPSGQWIEGALPLVLPDHGADIQRLGSAITYIRRYLLCTMLGVVAADEDDDGASAMGRA